MEDLDRAYVINGNDLRIALAGMNGKRPSVPNPRTMAGDIIDEIGQPLDGHRALIGRARLAEQLDGFYLTVMPDSGPAVNGQVDNPGAVAALVFKEHAAAVKRGDREEPSRPEPDDDVVDAHICCEHIAEDPEVSAMARIVRLMETNPLDGHAVIRALYPLSGPALPRVLRWFLARFPDPGDLPF